MQVDESAERSTARTEAALDESGFGDFSLTGTEVAGEFRCADCGYGAVVQRALPLCPMCGGSVWKSRAPLSPRVPG